MEAYDLWRVSRTLGECFRKDVGMVELEAERLREIEQIIPRFKEGFPWKVLSESYTGCPLKFLVQNYLYGRDQFDLGENG